MDKEENLLFLITKLQKITFIDTKNTIFSREIVYSIEQSEKNIEKYLTKCFPTIKVVNFQKFELGICIIKTPKKNQVSTDKISKYWIDGESFLINYKNKGEDKYIIVSIGIGLSMEKILRVIEKEIIDNEIIRVDKLNYCWIKNE